ncbi:hypothetical protein RFI_16248 [Reticulomyxa filosa]|uniref:Uncharacterized protein n=1 Tax=Reticulomyxa filosa TaxID=46433 RepID=X6N4M8_RETFI|nr:hypothetical protein RFI_16248 [Reticulomyxa filosa]|eukprot:ETO20956.1 hypothetical protein RFI_16248 [Reticulomyxa filosa]
MSYILQLKNKVMKMTTMIILIVVLICVVIFVCWLFYHVVIVIVILDIFRVVFVVLNIKLRWTNDFDKFLQFWKEGVNQYQIVVKLCHCHKIKQFMYGIFYYFDRMKRHMFIQLFPCLLDILFNLCKKENFPFKSSLQISTAQKLSTRKGDKEKTGEEPLEFFFCITLISIEYKTSEVIFNSLSLEILEDKVKELISNRTDLEAENPFNFKIMDINYQCINTEQKLRNAFDTVPVCFFVHFIGSSVFLF